MIDLESELQGDTEEIVFALLMTPTEYDAYVVHKAVEEMGTSELTLIGILCTRSSKVGVSSTQIWSVDSLVLFSIRIVCASDDTWYTKQ